MQNPKSKDPRNHLNDLTGREWVHFLSSVEATAYPTTGPQSYGHKLRRAHPSPKPPQLMRRIIEFFTRQGEWVLDPFMGTGTTVVAAELEGARAIGIDLDPAYVAIAHARLAEAGHVQQSLVGV